MRMAGEYSSITTWMVLLLVSMATLQMVKAHGDHHHDEYEYDDDDDDFMAEAPVENVLNKQKFVHNAKHLEQHFNDIVEIELGKASDEELEFHFFELHDLNVDKLLDGLELYAALGHNVDSYLNKMAKKKAEVKLESITRMYLNVEQTVDKIMQEEDKNDDGYLTYAEYASSRRVHKMLKNVSTDKKT